jgi:small subunit ribosomal protein S17
MFRRKKKEEQTDAPPAVETSESAAVEEAAAPTAESSAVETVAAEPAATVSAAEPEITEASAASVESVTGGRRGNRVQKVGTVSSDKMQKTVIVRVDRLVLHPKYRRYVRRTSKFMAHDDLGATTGDRVRIVETRPLSTKKRWRVVEIVQKAAK